MTHTIRLDNIKLVAFSSIAMDGGSLRITTFQTAV